ncbi:hypothetical protein CLOSTASPAR_05678 [[Clostridium] asparagiforme DSM 15981]|uniref:Uncharacterized protein n=1 Tax=[Clostridium] asparagiforme DSM 15981 TaxID=518636 RepID=C0D8S9_9FIRM|nr:hypothetical protein CLOSTASPAR_05678 [[Clostridium] asparagiforme DSM 15981]
MWSWREGIFRERRDQLGKAVRGSIRQKRIIAAREPQNSPAAFTEKEV